MGRSALQNTHHNIPTLAHREEAEHPATNLWNVWIRVIHQAVVQVTSNDDHVQLTCLSVVRERLVQVLDDVAGLGVVVP
ncbi:hypothetical protein D3C73_861130 [compost metagenome]